MRNRAVLGAGWLKAIAGVMRGTLGATGQSRATRHVPRRGLVLIALLLWSNFASAITLEQLQQRFAQQPLIRADFTQTRTIAGMAQPLVSQGKLIIARQQGLWWHQSTPFTMTLLLDDRRMVQVLSNQPPQVVTADSNPQMFQFNHLLRALFQADEKVLAQNFRIDFQSQGEQHWTLSLTPTTSPLTLIFTRIDLAGGEFLDQIALHDKQGDNTLITLYNTRLTPPQLSDEERTLFAAP